MSKYKLLSNNKIKQKKQTCQNTNLRANKKQIGIRSGFERGRAWKIPRGMKQASCSRPRAAHTAQTEREVFLTKITKGTRVTFHKKQKKRTLFIVHLF